MNTLTCFIVDDEPLAVKMLENYVGRTEGLVCTASFTDSQEALDALDAQPVDIVFLDIQMPGLDGLALSRQVPKGTHIVFTTAFKEYAFDSYEVEAVDFLLKPIRYQKFLTAVEKVRARRAPAVELPTAADESASIFIRVDNMLRRVDFGQIMYVSGMKDYVMFYLVGERRPLVSHLTMKAVEAMLPPRMFMRVHRSYIVALGHIRSIDRNNCIYIGDEVVHVTDAYREAFETYLATRVVK